MVSPLIENAQIGSICKSCNTVLSDNCHTKAGNELVDTVVYLLVDVIRTTRDDDYLSALGSCLIDYLHSLASYLIMVSFKSLISFVNRLGYLALDIVLLQHIANYLYDVLSDVEIEVRVNEVLIIKARIVCEEKLRIIRYHRTIEVIVAVAFVKVIAHTRIEYEVNALVEEVLDMTVSELCRIANRIRRDSVLSEVVHITGAFIGDDRSESESCEQHMPERELLIESKSERKSDNTAVTLRLVGLDGIEYAVVLELVEVRDSVPVYYSAALFAAIARNKASALAEADNIELTVRRTAAAVHRA